MVEEGTNLQRETTTMERQEGSKSSSTALISAEMEKKRKKNKKETTISSNAAVDGVAGNDDMVSSLPDDLLHYIFSFLDIDYAIKCSVLSKRWRYLWTTLPYLNFNHKVPYGRDYYTHELEMRLTQRFRVFVDSVLSRRNGSTDTNTFRLNYRVYTNFARQEFMPNKWIQYAISHNVEEFDVTSEDDCTLTRSIINDLCATKSLRSLKLSINYRQELIKPSFGLLCLKYLHLMDTRFDNIEDLGKVVLGCPLLETLIIRSCIFGPSESLTISSSRLEHLEMTDLSCYDDIHNIEECRPINITLSTPKLIYLKYEFPFWMMHDYFLWNMSSLMKADISFSDEAGHSNDQLVCAKKAIKFLRGIANVKYLIFSPDRHTWLIQAMFEVPGGMSVTFHNLNFLKLTIPQICRGEICDIAYILEMCPNIERLVLVLLQAKSRGRGEIKRVAAYPPSRCMLLHLKHVEIQNAVKGIDELDKFKHFLNKSMANLEKFVVIPSLP